MTDFTGPILHYVNVFQYIVTHLPMVSESWKVSRFVSCNNCSSAVSNQEEQIINTYFNWKIRWQILAINATLTIS